MTTREEVYAAIDGEREYQCKWETSDSKGLHEVGAFILFMEDYLHEARHQLSRAADPEASQAALSTPRKVIALDVACMEQHGAPEREGFES